MNAKLHRPTQFGIMNLGEGWVGVAMVQLDLSIALEKNSEGIRAAVFENGRVVSFYFQNDAADLRIGDIFLGRISENRLSQVGWFVDLGEGRSGFLPHNRCTKHGPENKDAFILVQVDKEPWNQKEAELTEHVQMKGKNIIYLPYSAYVAGSRRLSEQVRDSLKRAVAAWCADDEGMIVRTSAAKQPLQTLRQEFLELKDQWRSVEKTAFSSTQPRRLFRQLSFLGELLNAHHFPDHCTVLTNFMIAQDEIPEGVSVRHLSEKNIFRSLNIESIYTHAFASKIALESGASLVIDYTEALTTIDVNSGSMKIQKNRDEAIRRINFNAASEIARQLRLRQIGGIVVIDFLRMNHESDRQALLQQLIHETKPDPNHVQVYGFTRVGLVEVTRKRQSWGIQNQVMSMMKNAAQR